MSDGVTLELSRRRDGCRLSLPLTDPYTLVGRGSRCTLRLDDPQVAAMQAAFVWQGGRVFLIDSGRLTFGPIDSLRDQTWQWGEWTVGICDEQSRPVTIATGPIASLVWQVEGLVRPTQLSRPVTVIGATPLCSVQLHQPSVVPLHAALVRTDAAIWLVNLTDRTATRVNGRPVEFAALDPGDILTFGAVTAEVAAAWSEPATQGITSESTTAPVLITGWGEDTGGPKLPPVAPTSLPAQIG